MRNGPWAAILLLQKRRKPSLAETSHFILSITPKTSKLSFCVFRGMAREAGETGRSSQWHRRDLNPHAPCGTADFKSAMSAYSITVPLVVSYSGVGAWPPLPASFPRHIYGHNVRWKGSPALHDGDSPP